MAVSKELSNASYGSYGGLLTALRASQKSNLPRKRRRLNGSKLNDTPGRSQIVQAKVPLLRSPIGQQRSFVVETDKVNDTNPAARDSDEEDLVLEDPFQQHYVTSFRTELAGTAKSQPSKIPRPTVTVIGEDVRKNWAPTQEGTREPSAARRVDDLHLKQRLLGTAQDLFQSLSLVEKDIAGSVSSYRDVLVGMRTVKNARALTELCMLHCLNHVFKTRDRVLKNNAKLSQVNNDEPIEARDQGFCRPKVLIIVPTKQNCLRFVESIAKLSEPEQQENKSRFLEQFSRDDGDEWQDKPEDFLELFGGNHEEDFRIGLKFTRKTIKFFSGFYNSDIIITSPLGLRRAITGGGNEEEGKSHDSDFLSSIEVVVVDQASALQMQNWEHVEFAFSQLNLLPKESHGCDFSRVQSWYLDGHAKYLRQTIILSPFLTPEVSSLAATHLHNVAGRLKYMPEYKGAMVEVPRVLPMTVHQTFVRFDAATAASEVDARFKLFTSTILAQLLREAEHLRGVLVFVPAYSDFVRVRNHLTTSLERTATSFGNISEYTPVKEVNRARSHFSNGRYSLLIYSERAHHHFRYRLRGVQKIVFYGLPENPIFWTEIVSLLALTGETPDGDKKGKGLIRAFFSRWDAMKLERIVGTERVARLLSERSGDTFDFV